MNGKMAKMLRRIGWGNRAKRVFKRMNKHQKTALRAQSKQ